jgi:hypothetical protein
MVVGGKGGGWDRPQEPPREPMRDSMVEQIGKMAQQSQEGVVLDAVEPDDTAGYAPNTKKRMMEVEPSTQIRDEL